MVQLLLRYILPVILLAGCSTTTSVQDTSSRSTASDRDQSLWYAPAPADDAGMWLLPQIRGAVHTEMAEKGLRLSSDDIYSASHPSLNQAIVRINIGEGGGGTGSFLSRKGLILTNHHVAYDAIAAASTTQRNMLEQGFYAETLSEEIPIDNYSLYIPIEQVEVTQKINNRISDDLDYARRVQRKQQIEEELIAERTDTATDIVVEIDDYWAGNRQFMVVYQVIQDVRLVYAPPSSIGKYGGDIDNWMWPRHTGDYAFLRAYVSPGGEAREYSDENVPFTPGHYLKIDPSGVTPGDFTMVLGFPGSTHRYESSYAFDFYENQRNNILIESMQAILDALEHAARQDPDAAVSNASERASYANSLKYFQGIQTGFEKYDIVERKRAQEQRFQEWVQEDSARTRQYGQVLNQLDQAYDIASQTGALLYATSYPLNYNALLQIAALYQPYYEYLLNPDDRSFTEAQKDSLLASHREILRSTNVEAQTLMLAQMLHTLTSLPEGKVPVKLISLFGRLSDNSQKQAIARFLNSQQDTSLIFDPEKAQKFLELPPRQAASLQKDRMITLFEELNGAAQFARDNYVQHFPHLLPAQQLYVKGMMEFRNDATEYPDANFTLRMSGGRIQGYSPADGVYYTPFTTLEGMLAKDTDEEPFDAPDVLERNYRQMKNSTSSDSLHFTSDGRMVVNFLSTNDITGGNSGSPVLDADGEVVGLAFDGNIEGVVGDYFYDPELNRTISVDIRYILFLMSKFSNTERLLKEIELVE